jgi:aerobic-type carbon monoxide dehydrogenase small subunit (CoxS/CutS family)
MTLEPLLRTGQRLDDGAIRVALAGNLCRSIRYQEIIEAVRRALDECADGR